MQAQVYQDRYAKAEAKRREAAKELLEYHLSGIRRWLFAHRREDNHPFFLIHGTEMIGKDGERTVPTYYVDLHDCTCDSHSKGRVACKHMLAVRLWFDGVKRGDIAPPGAQTREDGDLLEQASAIAEALDIAEAADALLEKYDQLQAEQRKIEPAIDWWTADNGAIVWLQEGDIVTHEPAPIQAEGPMTPRDGVGQPSSESEVPATALTECDESSTSRQRAVSSEEPPSHTEPATPKKPVGLVLRYEDMFGPEDD